MPCVLIAVLLDQSETLTPQSANTWAIGTPAPPNPIRFWRMIATEQIENVKSDLRWTEHPLVDLDERFRRLTEVEFLELADAVGQEAALEYFKAREKRIADAERDPFRHEFRLPHWDDVEEMVKDKTVTFVPGGNNPGKSWWSGSLAMRFLTRRFSWDNQSRGKLRVLMIAQDELASQMFQQPAVYAHLPIEWRVTNESGKKPPGFAKCINYGEKLGFTEGTFVLPRPLRGQCWFKTVAQYTREPKSFEGPAFDLVIIDEGCPLALFKSLLGRVAKVGGRIIYLLTCIHGYDQTMGQGLEGAKLTRSLAMQWDWLKAPSSEFQMPITRGGINPEICFPELRVTEQQSDLLKRLHCPAGHMPYMMQPLNPNWGVVFMWNTFNPFQVGGKWLPPNVKREDVKRETRYWGHGTMPAMFDACVGQPKWKVLVIIFGWIERVGQLAIGNFNPEVHVVRGEAREKLDQMVRDGKAAIYTGSDPETQRSHAILWQATFPPCPQWPNGLKYLFDESPRITEGEWVNSNGERGEGQYVYKATGSNWYKRYMRERERDWGICDAVTLAQAPNAAAGSANTAALHPCVVMRRGDPRGFATEESTATGTRSLFELYLEDHSKENPDYAPMIFTPAKIRRSSTLDIDVLIDMFRYDVDKYQRDGGFTAENTPARLISDRCENYIRCALNYTLTDLGKKEEDNPNADFIDADRYLNSGDTPYVDLSKSGEESGGAWG